MYIRKLFAQKPCVFSIEFFPPKQVLNWPKLQTTLQQVKRLHPDFVSITCSAGGSGVGGVSTCEVARYVKNQLDMEPLAHLTCTGSDRAGGRIQFGSAFRRRGAGFDDSPGGPESGSRAVFRL